MVASSNQLRLLVTSSTATAAATLVDGHTTRAAIQTALRNAAGATQELAYNTGNATENRKRGMEIVFFGTAAADKIGNWKLRQIKSCANDTCVEVTLMCSGTFTLGTCTGAGTASLITSSELIADTITFTDTAFATALYANYSGGIATSKFSPADNTPARLFIPDMGGGDYLLEVYRNDAATVNAIVELQT